MPETTNDPLRAAEAAGVTDDLVKTVTAILIERSSDLDTGPETELGCWLANVIEDYILSRRDPATLSVSVSSLPWLLDWLFRDYLRHTRNFGVQARRVLRRKNIQEFERADAEGWLRQERDGEALSRWLFPTRRPGRAKRVRAA